MKTYVLPGMGADRRMYPDPWDKLPGVVFIDWPAYGGERTVREMALRVIAEHGVGDGAVVVGSSLGGMVACEIAKLRSLRRLVLVGSATTQEEVSAFLRLASPLIGLTPVEFVQRMAGKLPMNLTRMFQESDAAFIRAMCHAIFHWDGLGLEVVQPLRIHGRRDRVIPLPGDVDCTIDGGHLIAMTHAVECVRFLRERWDGW